MYLSSNRDSLLDEILSKMHLAYLSKKQCSLVEDMPISNHACWVMVVGNTIGEKSSYFTGGNMLVLLVWQNLPMIPMIGERSNSTAFSVSNMTGLEDT
ncbi:hypothetical protein Tco_1516425 [Tanacetum coccineum]